MPIGQHDLDPQPAADVALRLIHQMMTIIQGRDNSHSESTVKPKDTGIPLTGKGAGEQLTQLIALLQPRLRQLQFASLTDREQSTVQNRAMDEADLKLASLRYERDLLARRLEGLLTAPTLHEQIALPPIESSSPLAISGECMDVDPTSLEDDAQPIAAAIDEHLLMKKRLGAELVRRRDLQAQEKRLVVQQQDLILRNKLKAQKLSALTDELVKATHSPALDTLRKKCLPVTSNELTMETLDATTRQWLPSLPRPLYNVFVLFLGHKQAGGRTSAIRSIRITQSTSPESTKQTDANDGSSNLNANYEVHALDVSILYEHSVNLRFQYLPNLAVVVASFVTKIPSLSSVILQGLFSGDVGLDSPNPANVFLDQTTESQPFEFDVSHVLGGGRPYRWAQILAGLNFPYHLETSSTPPSVVQIVWVLERAVVAGIMLYKEVSNIPALNAKLGSASVMVKEVQSTDDLAVRLFNASSMLAPAGYTVHFASKSAENGAVISALEKCQCVVGLFKEESNNFTPVYRLLMNGSSAPEDVEDGVASSSGYSIPVDSVLHAIQMHLSHNLIEPENMNK